ncbi:MAG: DMT family transporter [Promethearchaeota archaeon]
MHIINSSENTCRNNRSDSVNPSISKLCMFLSAIAMGNVGLIVSYLSNYPVYTIVLLRGIFGTFFLTLFLIIGRSFSWKFIKESIKLHWKSLIIIAIVNPLVIYLYFLNITISNYSIAAFLLYTSGIFLLAILIITKTERVSRINFISFLLAILGVAIIMEFWRGIGFTPGIIIGILSGFTLSILTFYKKKIYNFRKENPSKLKEQGDFDTFLAWFSTLFIIIMFFPLGVGDLPKLSLEVLLIALLLGLIPTALAFALYNVGIKNDKGGNIVIIAYFEPVMATINTIIFQHTFSIFVIIGGVFILLANFFVLKYSSSN